MKMRQSEELVTEADFVHGFLGPVMMTGVE